MIGYLAPPLIAAVIGVVLLVAMEALDLTLFVGAAIVAWSFVMTIHFLLGRIHDRDD